MRAPQCPEPVEGRLASRSTLQCWKESRNTASLRSPLRFAVRAPPGPDQRGSKRAVTRDALHRLIANLRDGTSSRYAGSLRPSLGVRLLRCSEMGRLRVEQLRDEPPARLDLRDPKSPILPNLAIQLRRTRRQC